MTSLLAFAHSSLTGASAFLASILIASIWQALLLTAAVALLLFLLPDLSAAARATVWTAVLLLVVALPVLALTLARPRSSGGGGLIHLEHTVSLALVALWAAASAFRLFQLTASATRLHQVLGRAHPVAVPEAIAPLLAGPRRIVLCNSPDVDRPSVAGFLRPRILFPPKLLAELNTAELGHIVLHETEHLRRHDDWINLFQQVTLVLFPLNPALLWLNRRLSLERELACDDTVLQATRARKGYAACLTRVAETSVARRSAALVLGMLGDWFSERRPELTRRVERILRAPAHSMGPLQTRLASGVLIAGLLGGAAVLAHAPALVSFAAPSPALAQSAAGGGTDLPASPAGIARPVLAKAVMTSGASSTRAAFALPSRHRQFRTTLHRHPSVHRGPWVVLTSWRSPEPAPQPQAGSLPVATSALHLTTVVIQDSQHWYTALAFRDGWIVVQL